MQLVSVTAHNLTGSKEEPCCSRQQWDQRQNKKKSSCNKIAGSIHIDQETSVAGDEEITEVPRAQERDGAGTERGAVLYRDSIASYDHLVAALFHTITCFGSQQKLCITGNAM